MENRSNKQSSGSCGPAYTATPTSPDGPWNQRMGGASPLKNEVT